MKILFVWTGVTGYMADCWRKLQKAEGVELKVVVEMADSGKAYDAAKTLEGIDCEVVDKADGFAGHDWRGIPAWRPDVVFAGGWRSPTTRRMLDALPKVPKVFCLDMPWRLSPRCFAARFLLRPFLRRFDAVFVPGKSSRTYARWLGFAHERIYDRLYAVDVARLRAAAASVSCESRRGFLYVGRYSPEKRVDLVERAYAEYKRLGGSWPLDCYGQGGRFVQPDEMPRVYSEHACLLLASAFDPWPLVMLESKAAGLDVIASDRCGNCDELGAIKVPYGNVAAMAQAMLRVEKAWNEGRPEGEAADVSKYSCEAWPRRVLEICAAVRRGSFYCPGMDDVANGMAMVARKLAEDARFAREYIVHGAWLPRVWLHCLAGLFRGVRYVRMPHGAYSPVYLEGNMRKRLVRPIERFFLRNAKKVIVTCKAEMAWVEAYEPKAKTELVDLRGLDWSPAGKLRSASPRQPSAALHVLYMGRRHPLKGIHCLEEACFPMFELKVVSDARGAEKESAFDWCDVVCLPTLSENFGIVVAEALARGKPVITTDGAPAWSDEPRVGADGMTRLVYLEGYCAASAPVRVAMLRSALCRFATKGRGALDAFAAK